MRPPKVTLTIDLGSHTFVAPSIDDVERVSIQQIANEAADEIRAQLAAITNRADKRPSMPAK